MIRLNDLQWYHNKSVECIMSGEYLDAIRLLTRLVELDPLSAEAFYNWGLALTSMEQHEAAYEKYLKAIELKPDYADACYNCARSLIDMERYFQAAKMLEKFISLEPDAVEAYYLWGDCLGKAELYRQACEKYAIAVEMDPSLFFVYVNWGLAIFNLALETPEGSERQALLEEEKQKYLMAEEIEPGSGSYNLACVLCLEGDLRQCRNWLEKGSYTGHLPSYEYAVNDEDLQPVAAKPWFKHLQWGEKDI